MAPHAPAPVILVVAAVANLILASAIAAPAEATTLTFQQGVGGYSGTLDTELDDSNPNANLGGAVSISVDGSPERHGLIRFDGIFGGGAGQIPLGSTINSASVTFEQFDPGSSSAVWSMHRMLVTWSESSTWNSMSNGIQTDDVEALSTADASATNLDVTGPRTFTGLAAALQAWSDGDANFGWAMFNSQTNGIDFDSSEGTPTLDRPLLTVDFTEPNTPPTCDAGGPYAADVGASITFDGSGSSDADGTITAYDWDFGDGNTGSGVNAAHAYAAGGVYTITLCVTDDDASQTCCTTTADINVAPVCDTGGPYAADVGDSITFDGSGSSDADGTITAYDWDFGDGNTGSGVNAAHAYAAGGVYTVTLCVTDDDASQTCCTTTADINAAPVCDAGGPYAADVGDSITFDGSGSSDADGTITAYDWDFGDGNTGSGVNAAHAYAVGGVYTVTLCVTDDDGAQTCCTTTADINVAPVCDAGGPYAANVGASITFDGSGSSDTDGTITAYDWDFGDGNTASGVNAAHAYAAGGVYTVTLCVTDDDASQICCTTTADINAAPVCDAGGPYAGDVGDSITFDGSGSSDADGTITAYHWDFGDGNTGSGVTAAHAYAAGGVYTVTLCVTDDDASQTCCTTTADINAAPACDAGGPYAANVGDSITFDGSGSSDADGTIAAYDWDFGDGNSGSGVNAAHAYAAGGVYTVTLCVTDDDAAQTCCTTTADINATPVCDAGGPYAANVGDSITFDGSGSSDADGTIAAYDWDFGDGNSGSGVNAAHTYAAAAVYTVTLCVTDDDGAQSCCTTTATISDVPNVPPTCNAGGPYASDVGASITFDGSGSSDADGTITAYDWDFGDGNSGSGVNAAHTYTTAGSFTVTLCVTDDDAAQSCCSTTADINALPLCDAAGPYAANVGGIITFEGSGSSDPDGTIDTYDWDFGDGSTDSGMTVTHTYTTGGTYTVTLCVTDDAGAQVCCTTTADINAPPICDAGGPYAAHAGQPLTFDGSGSSDPDGMITAYIWDFGDGASDTGEMPTHTYAAAGTYTVTLCISDGSTVVCCQTTAEIDVPNQAPSCDAGGPYDGLVGDSFPFDASASSDADGTIATYDWDFGDGSTDTGVSASHTYATLGVYTVTLCVTDDDGSQACCTTTATAREWTDVTSGPLGDLGEGRGIAWGDFDGDGDSDLYVANNNTPNQLFENQAGVLVDVTPAILADAGGGQGVAWADSDRDGDLDLYLSNFAGPNRLYRNDGVSGFTEVAAGTPLEDTGNARTVAWADYDGDGDPDLYLANVSGVNRLFENELGNNFSITGLLDDPLGSQGVAWADYDQDGDPDLFVANGNAPNRLYRNDTVPGFDAFVDVAPGTDVEDPTGFSIGCNWGDVDNDGDADLYVGDNGGENRLYRNDGNDTFVEIGSGTPLADTGDSRGLGLADHDNDGDLDIYVANVGGTNSHFRNDGGNTWTDITLVPLDDAADSFAMAWADYDGDGDQDMFVTNNQSANKLYRNDAAALGRHWLQVRTVGTLSNSDGIGARVEVVTASGTQFREIRSGGGWYSQDQLKAAFGLGTDTVVDTVRVLWPWGESGVLDTLNVAVDQCIVLEQPLAGAIDEQTATPLALRVYQNAPNPFNPTTEIRYDLPAATRVRLRIYDISGHVVRQLVDAPHEAGRHSAVWDGRNDVGERLVSGLYLYRIEAGALDETRRMLMLK